MRIRAILCLVAAGGSVGLGWTNAVVAQGQTNQTQANLTQGGQTQANQTEANLTQSNQRQVNQGAQGAAGGINTQSGFNGGISQTPWFSNPTIRQQLQLNEEQFNKLNNAYSQSYNRYNEGFTGLDKNLPEAQRAQRLEELNRGFSNEFSKSFDGVFANDAARQRFNQMEWQYRGYGAFSDPSVQKQLNLSDEQLQRLNKYHNDWHNQMGTWRREYMNDRESVANNFRDARRETQNRINSVLNPEQRRMWTDMTGKPYDWPAEAYFSNPSTSNSTSDGVIRGTADSTPATPNNPKR